jgi:hypothetical protein
MDPYTLPLPPPPPAPPASKKAARRWFWIGGSVALAVILLAAIGAVSDRSSAGGTIFVDDFSDTNSGWASWEDSSSSGGYSNGSYQIVIHQPGRTDQASSYTDKGSDGVTLVADVTHSAASPEGFVGITCENHQALGASNGLINGTEYLFEIDPTTGAYEILRLSDSPPATHLVDGTDTGGVIHRGGATNRFFISCIGTGPGTATKLILQVNGSKLGEYEDTNGLGPFNAAGLVVTSLSDSGVSGTFDNLDFRKAG